MNNLEEIIRQKIAQYEEQASMWERAKSRSITMILANARNAEMYHDMANDLKFILKEAGLVA